LKNRDQHKFSLPAISFIEIPLHGLGAFSSNISTRSSVGLADGFGLADTGVVSAFNMTDLQPNTSSATFDNYTALTHDKKNNLIIPLKQQQFHNTTLDSNSHTNTIPLHNFSNQEEIFTKSPLFPSNFYTSLFISEEWTS
jgi:hypothetical protein